MKPASVDWIRAVLYGGYWKEVLITALIITTAWLVAQIYLYLVDKLVLRPGRAVPTLGDRIWRAVRIPGAVIVVTVGTYAAIHRYKFGFLPFLDQFLFVLSVCNIIYAAISVMGVTLEWYAEKISSEREGETVARELLPLVDKVAKIVIAGIGLIVVLDRFSIDIKSVLVTLGVGSLAVGLALQDTLANMFGGFTIMLDRPFRIGDRIQLQSGEQGDVRSIGMRATSVMMPDGNLLVIPNSYLVKNMVINRSFPDSRCLMAVKVKVAPDSDLEIVKKLMLEAARKNSRVLHDPAPSALFDSFGTNALVISMTCFARNYLESGAATDEINSAIHAALRQAGVHMSTDVIYVKALTAETPRSSESRKETR